MPPKESGAVQKAAARCTTIMFNFEKLDTWQEAIAFGQLVYAATRGFPTEERFGLCSQMRRAAVSVSSNIAEGSARVSRPEFARFVEISTGSLFEVVSQAVLSQREDFLTPEHYQKLCGSAEQLGKMLSGLRRSLLDGR